MILLECTLYLDIFETKSGKVLTKILNKSVKYDQIIPNGTIVRCDGFSGHVTDTFCKISGNIVTNAINIVFKKRLNLIKGKEAINFLLHNGWKLI